MSEKVNLFSLSAENIKITIDASFKDGDLLIEGYDIGKIVEECWGDSDYEYSITVKRENIDALCQVLNITTGSHDAILDTMKENFSGNTGFSAFGTFLTKNGIDYDSFSWA